MKIEKVIIKLSKPIQDNPHVAIDIYIVEVWNALINIYQNSLLCKYYSLNSNNNKSSNVFFCVCVSELNMYVRKQYIYIRFIRLKLKHVINTHRLCWKRIFQIKIFVAIAYVFIDLSKKPFMISRESPQNRSKTRNLFIIIEF